MNRKYMSPREVGELFGLSAQTIRNYCKAGMFPGARKPSEGSVWLIPAGAVDAFAEPPAVEPLARSSRSRGRGRAA